MFCRFIILNLHVPSAMKKPKTINNFKKVHASEKYHIRVEEN